MRERRGGRGRGFERRDFLLQASEIKNSGSGEKTGEEMHASNFHRGLSVFLLPASILFLQICEENITVRTAKVQNNIEPVWIAWTKKYSFSGLNEIAKTLGMNYGVSSFRKDFRTSKSKYSLSFFPVRGKHSYVRVIQKKLFRQRTFMCLRVYEESNFAQFLRGRGGTKKAYEKRQFRKSFLG